MAWLSAGTSNEDLIDQMITNGVIQDPQIENAFRFTDRGDFVLPELKRQAYIDRPVKASFMHLSAPHMYATVLEQLELTPGLSFLNIGSGSGYLSCLASCLLGENGLSHGIDVNNDVVNHSIQACRLWFERIVNARENGQVIHRALIYLNTHTLCSSYTLMYTHIFIIYIHTLMHICILYSSYIHLHTGGLSTRHQRRCTFRKW